ncbi:MAG: delta-lactam-biosynthetic de-N-acetylase [Clostridia bacterium]|nr:delta-lactam-biosynthetic de-N-acetylase [Clostridia bacterium]
MKIFCAIFLSVILFSGCTQKSVFKTEITEDVQVMTNTVMSVSEKQGWGLKKNKNAPPDVPEQTIELLKKYGAIYKSDESKTLYLTFDEGYENGYTAKILDVLGENQVPAAFFVTGPYIKKEKELVKRMTLEGHIVGNHTVNHPSLPDVSEEEIKSELENLSKSYYDLCGKEMKFFRPPMGEYSEKTLDITSKMGYTNVFWSFAYKDWETNNQKGTGYAYNQIMEGVHDGAILLLHAVSKDNAEVLDKVIKDLKSQGYVFKSLEELKK